MAVGQLRISWLIHHYREQAPSHTWICCVSVIEGAGLAGGGCYCRQFVLTRHRNTVGGGLLPMTVGQLRIS